MLNSQSFTGNPHVAAQYCDSRNDDKNLKMLVAELHSSVKYVNMRTVYTLPYITVVLDDHPYMANHDQPTGRRTYCDVYLTATSDRLEGTFDTPEEFYAWVLARFW